MKRSNGPDDIPEGTDIALFIITVMFLVVVYLTVTAAL
jgi:hypothetical protein